MAIQSLFLTVQLNGRTLNQIPQSTKAIDEYVWHDLTVTSNQSNLSINFGGVATGQSLYCEVTNSMTVSLNNTTIDLATNGFFLIHLTSMSTATITNNAVTTVAQVRFGIFGT